MPGASTLANPISGDGLITKGGSGLLVLSAANTFYGSTVVCDGELRVAGSIAGTITVVGGTLSGTGSTGDVTGDGGSLSPGVGGVGSSAQAMSI